MWPESLISHFKRLCVLHYSINSCYFTEPVFVLQQPHLLLLRMTLRDQILIYWTQGLNTYQKFLASERLYTEQGAATSDPISSNWFSFIWKWALYLYTDKSTRKIPNGQDVTVVEFQTVQSHFCDVVYKGHSSLTVYYYYIYITRNQNFYGVRYFYFLHYQTEIGKKKLCRRYSNISANWLLYAI